MGEPKKGVQELASKAQLAGYEVREAGPYDFTPDQLTLNIEGHGEWLEAYFLRHPATGTWRWHGGFVHNDHGGGDRLLTLKNFRAVMLGHPLAAAALRAVTRGREENQDG